MAKLSAKTGRFATPRYRAVEVATEQRQAAASRIPARLSLTTHNINQS